MMKKLPSGWWSRSGAVGRMVGRLGVSGARRLVRGAAEEAELGEALFAELDKMKGMAMKVGQILSYMDVGLPDETVTRLAKLQEGAEPCALDVIADQVEVALGRPLSACFVRFDAEPVAAASVGQVHRAAVDGVGEVAVKVRYPGVEATIAADFSHLERLGRIASAAAAVDGRALVRELRTRMIAECDYGLEARSQALFADLLSEEPGLTVPAVIGSHCGEGVLTTAWDDGMSFLALREQPAEVRRAAAVQLARFPWLTVLAHGVLQADPHPGNFRFAPDGRVTALDFGCVRHFEPRQVEAFRNLVRVVVHGERSRLRHAVVQAGLAPRPERLDYDELWGMMRWMFAPYLTETFAFERDWWTSGLHYTRPTHRNMWHQGLPPHWLWLQRALFGLHAVLGKLQVDVPLRAQLDALLDRPLVPVATCEAA